MSDSGTRVLVPPHKVLDRIRPLYPSPRAPQSTAPPETVPARAPEREKLEAAVRVLRTLIGTLENLIEESDDDVAGTLREQQARIEAEERSLRAQHLEQVERVLTEYNDCLRELCESYPTDQR